LILVNQKPVRAATLKKLALLEKKAWKALPQTMGSRPRLLYLQLNHSPPFINMFLEGSSITFGEGV